MRQYRILALVLLGALSWGCTKEIPDLVGNDGTGPVTTTVSLGEASGTKALTTEGIKTFAAGDQVAIVYTNTADATVKAVSEPLTADSILDGGKMAVLTVTLTDPKPSGAVSYIYPAAMAAADGSVNYAALAVQDGTLSSLAAGLDLCTFEGELSAGAGLPVRATLENRLTIGEFTVEDEGGSDITASIVCFSISAGAETYTVSRAAGSGPIYVAMKPVSGDLNLIAADADWHFYKKDVTTPQTLAANKMYPIAVTMAQSSFEARFTPLTFEAITAGAQVSFRLPSNTEAGSVQYRTEGGSWTEYTSESPITLANAGDKVLFRGKNSTYYVNTSTYDYGLFSVTADCYLYGNIMSLVTDYTTDENAFASNVSLTGGNTFFRLFKNVSKIKSLDTKPLVLPATSLAGSCYDSMFYGCTSLEVAPALPATSLAGHCYDSMFSGCTSVEVAPVLLATSLASSCYDSMFSGCSSLEVAPALPATSLARDCYNAMFSGCTSLEVAPTLPAMSLADHCYDFMFSGCSNLSSITCLAEKNIQGNCSNWVIGVASTGTFTRALEVNWPSDENGIPPGWTIIDYDANQ